MSTTRPILPWMGLQHMHREPDTIEYHTFASNELWPAWSCRNTCLKRGEPEQALTTQHASLSTKLAWSITQTQLTIEKLQDCC